MAACGHEVLEGACFRPAGHKGGHGVVAYGKSGAGSFFVVQHGHESFTVHYSSTGFSSRLLGSYSDLKGAVAGLKRLKAEGIRR